VADDSDRRADKVPDGEELGQLRPPAAPQPHSIPDQTYEFRETAEKLSVGKELFVREEVVVKKLIETHTEQIRGSGRRTEVEVERLSPEAPAPAPEPAPRPVIQAPQAEAAPAPTSTSTGGINRPSVNTARSAQPVVPERPPTTSPRTEAPKKASAASDIPLGSWTRLAVLTLLAMLVAFYGAQWLGTMLAS
jgi:hypothetical protein